MKALDQGADDLVTERAPASRFLDRSRAVFETGLIIGGFLALFFLLPHALRGDDLIRFHDIEALLRRGHLTNSRYSLVMPLISVPVLLLGNAVESRAWWAGHFNVIVVAAGVVFAYRLLRGRVDPRLFRLIVLVLLFASFLTNRLRDYNAEVLTATLVTLGIICLVTNRYVVAGWAAIVIGVINTPAAIIAMALLACTQAVRTRQLRHLAPVAVAAAGIVAEDWIRRGGPFVTGYGHQSFSFPFPLGLAAILFSFGRGLIFFTPGLALWLDRRRRTELPGRGLVAMMLVFTAGLIVVYSTWWAWYGGLSWGPRFFLFAVIPASILLAAGIWQAGRSAAADAMTLGVLALSAWVSFAGVIADLKVVSTFCRDNWPQQYCLYNPQYSSLWQPVRQFPHLSASTTLMAAYCLGVLAYLAAPLVASLVRSVHPSRLSRAGWKL